MNELINILNDEAVTTSLQIAEVFGKQHYHVLEKIEQIKNDCPKNGGECFKASKYKDASGKSNTMYYITRDVNLRMFHSHFHEELTMP